MGRLVADLVLEAKSSSPDIPAGDFRLTRFAEGAPLTSPHPYIGAGQMGKYPTSPAGQVDHSWSTVMR